MPAARSGSRPAILQVPELLTDPRIVDQHFQAPLMERLDNGCADPARGTGYNRHSF